MKRLILIVLILEIMMMASGCITRRGSSRSNSSYIGVVDGNQGWKRASDEEVTRNAFNTSSF